MADLIRTFVRQDADVLWGSGLSGTVIILLCIIYLLLQGLFAGHQARTGTY
jgi:hypothetical protein